MLHTTPALAQTSGHLKGRVSDSLGVAIQKTQIIAEGSSGRFEATTNENGQYNLELPAGTYVVSTKKMPGFFSLTQKRVEVKPDKATKLNVKLKSSLEDAICVLTVTNTQIQKKNAIRKKKEKD